MASFSKIELERISQVTLRHYEENAASFWEGTRDHDVTQNYEALLSALPSSVPLEILDFGCGPGRDLFHFKKLGHNPTGLDGCEKFCAMARAFSNCPVLHQDFLRLDLPKEKFHGIFANAALFHIPRQELPRVLEELHSTLKPSGILFSSTPRGNGEGWTENRFGNFMEFEEYQSYLTGAGFQISNHYYRPKSLPRAQQPWLAVVSKKI